MKYRLATGRKKESGFTLIEVIIAMGIISVGLMAVLSMQTKSLQATHHAYNLTSCTAVAQEKLEEIVMTPYASLVSGTTGTETREVSQNHSYTVTWEVEDGANANTKFITITATMQGDDALLSSWSSWNSRSSTLTIIRPQL